MCASVRGVNNHKHKKIFVFQSQKWQNKNVAEHLCFFFPLRRPHLFTILLRSIRRIHKTLILFLAKETQRKRRRRKKPLKMKFICCLLFNFRQTSHFCHSHCCICPFCKHVQHNANVSRKLYKLNRIVSCFKTKIKAERVTLS